jgi:uncharacterized protein (TIGR03067 family)
VVAGIATVLVVAALGAAAFLVAAYSAKEKKEKAEKKEQAIKKDREEYEGTWRVVSLEMDGKKAEEEFTRKVRVQNRADTWIVQVEGKEAGRGTSTIDPTENPKTIDFTPTEGSHKGKLFLGIYALEGDSRKLCFAQPGKDRPTEFASKPGGQHCLVIFERVKD